MFVWSPFFFFFFEAQQPCPSTRAHSKSRVVAHTHGSSQTKTRTDVCVCALNPLYFPYFLFLWDPPFQAPFLLLCPFSTVVSLHLLFVSLSPEDSCVRRLINNYRVHRIEGEKKVFVVWSPTWERPKLQRESAIKRPAHSFSTSLFLRFYMVLLLYPTDMNDLTNRLIISRCYVVFICEWRWKTLFCVFLSKYCLIFKLAFQ